MLTIAMVSSRITWALWGYSELESAFDVEHLADEGLLAGRLNSHQITDFDGHKDRAQGDSTSNPCDSSPVLVAQGVWADWP